MRRKREQSKHKADAADRGGGAGSMGSDLASQRRTVRCEFTAPEAREVFVAGSFDDWKAGGLPMVRLDNGTWVKELVLEPGTYEYLFVVDGVWTPDPAASACVPNPYGGVNSCLTVS